MARGPPRRIEPRPLSRTSRRAAGEPQSRAGKPLAVACSAGNRSSLAVSLLRRQGVENVIHVADGGVADLADHGIQLVEGD